MVEPFVHPTAQVHPTAILRPGCWIGPNVIVGPGAIIGHYSVIGGQPEHAKFYDDIDGKTTKGVMIGPETRIFEFVTIQAGTQMPTNIRAGSAVFQHSHISHDCVLGRMATVCGRASLAGFVVVCERGIVGAHAIVHQHVVIGAVAMVGMAAAVYKHIPPGETWSGIPARQVGLNTIGIERGGYSEIGMKELELDFNNWVRESKL